MPNTDVLIDGDTIKAVGTDLSAGPTRTSSTPATGS
jgi:hypothetical protein